MKSALAVLFILLRNRPQLFFMKFFSVLTKREYQNDQGEIQSQWYKAGYLKETNNGGRFVRLFHQPDVSYYVIAQDEEDQVILLDNA